MKRHLNNAMSTLLAIGLFGCMPTDSNEKVDLNAQQAIEAESAKFEDIIVSPHFEFASDREVTIRIRENSMGFPIRLKVYGGSSQIISDGNNDANLLLNISFKSFEQQHSFTLPTFQKDIFVQASSSLNNEAVKTKEIHIQRNNIINLDL